MAKRYLQYFPKPLLDDLVAGRWLPVVGAGFSRNAQIGSGKEMPLWADLGRGLAADLQDYVYVNPIDAISAFEYEFGRAKLIEKIATLIHLGEARPGIAHHSFCSIAFDLICTTNIDFLLEAQYNVQWKPVTPLIEEGQLSINVNSSVVALLKLHGDLNHPSRLVVTESDYDLFLANYPIIATYLANLLITRTAVLVGYSLEDPDFRHLWQVIGDRLGKGRRSAYVLTAGAGQAEIARYERRGIKVINLSDDTKNYGRVLADAFSELKDYWSTNVFAGARAHEEDALQELSLPSGAATRLCLFAMPMSNQPFYRERIFPLVREAGLVPVTGDEIFPTGENWLAKMEALIARSFLVVVDVSSQYTKVEGAIAISVKPASSVCVIVENGISIPGEFRNQEMIRRPTLTSLDVGEFVEQFSNWLYRSTTKLQDTLESEMHRLLEVKEYRAAVISAITNLEAILRDKLDDLEGRSSRRVSLRHMLRKASEHDLLGRRDVEQVEEWLRVRNEVVHSSGAVSSQRAHAIVRGVEEIRGRVR